MPSVPAWVFLGGLAIVCASAQIFMQHKRYVGVLKWLTLSLFAYFAVLCVVHVRWDQFLFSRAFPSA